MGRRITVKVQHYGEQPQVMDTFKKREVAERYLHQQAEVIKGYEKRTGFVNGQFVVFGDEDVFKTRMWVSQ